MMDLRLGGSNAFSSQPKKMTSVPRGDKNMGANILDRSVTNFLLISAMQKLSTLKLYFKIGKISNHYSAVQT